MELSFLEKAKVWGKFNYVFPCQVIGEVTNTPDGPQVRIVLYPILDNQMAVVTEETQNSYITIMTDIDFNLIKLPEEL